MSVHACAIPTRFNGKISVQTHSFIMHSSSFIPFHTNSKYEQSQLKHVHIINVWRCFAEHGTAAEHQMTLMLSD